MKQTDLLIISCLRQDARMKLTDMSRKTGIPVSTIFDRIRMLEGGVIRKNTALVRFERLGFSTKTIITLAVRKECRQQLQEFLGKSKNVNSLYKINNGWDFLVEVVFPGVKEVEDFIEEIEGKVALKDKKIFYVIDEIKKEEFLSNPQMTKLEGGIR